MAKRHAKPCRFYSCPNLAINGEKYCQEHLDKTKENKKIYNKTYDTKSRDKKSKNFYNSTEWLLVRKAALARDNGLCQHCFKKGKIVFADVVHHMIEIKDDWSKRFNLDNLISLCHSCHNKIHKNREVGSIELYPKDIRPSKIPLIIVCGPPGSGKTTYVYKNKKDNDLVIELDEIKSRLSGLPLYQADNSWLKPAINERNRLLRSLSSIYKYDRAWFIVSAPSRVEREFWRNKLKPEKIIVLETPAEICINRIISDKKRTLIVKRQINAVKRWWQQYQRSNDDIIIEYKN